MNVYDFLYLLTDDSEMIAIYNLTTEEEVFCGEARDAMDGDFCGCEVMSFDVCRGDPRGVVLCLNIETEEEEDDPHDRWDVEPSRNDWDKEE